MYGCIEDRPIIDVLHYDFELKTWNKINEYKTPCYFYWDGWYGYRGWEREREFGHTIAMKGSNIYLACSEKVCNIYVKQDKSFEIAKLRDNPAINESGCFKVNQNSGFIDRFDFRNSSFTRFEKVGDLLEPIQIIRWKNIGLIYAILHNNVFFAVCLEHKYVIKVVLNQDQEQQETYSTRL